MRLSFTPKHQKLVNQCYPTGRTPDKKPKSSETSYLLYYVNSRRTKLEKVSTYLMKKSAADLNHRRIGNVSVTLELMNKIVVHCKENLNVFVKDFLQIMTKVLSNNNVNNDVTVVEKVEETFGSMCHYLDGALCSGDAEFIHLYQVFVNLYFQLVTDRLHNDDLLLKGTIDISQMANLASNPQINHLVSKSVTLALEKFQERHPRYQGQSLGGDEQPMSKRLTRTYTRTQGLDDAHQEGDFSIAALQSYFNTTETDKLTLSIHCLLTRLLETPNKELLQFICNGIPVQLRYIVILILIRGLNENNDHALVTLKLVSSLLVSEVSIVGLSVLDIMRKLLNIQLSNNTSTSLAKQCSATITDLNQKIYYKDQTYDMFSEILLRLKDENDEKHKAVLVGDLHSLILSTYEPSINLDLFLELAPYMDEYDSLFEIVDDSISGSFSMAKLFKFIGTLSTEEEQVLLMSKTFSKFKGFALLSGLNYYQEIVNGPPPGYYIYHTEAAKFLDLEDYKSQTQFKKENKLLFSREDLINYYSDSGSNKYSEKGAKILMSHVNHFSTTDLVSDTPEHSTSELPTIIAPPVPNSPRKNFSQMLNETHSLRSMRYTSPKVKDLKNVIDRKSSTIPKRNNTLRGSQSVKSKITNITFLLSELSHGSEEGKVRDPDEEEIVGMEKFDLARSHSTKLNFMNNSNSKRLSIPLVVRDEEDFKDASEDVEVPSTRGKLFST